jgi:hypothetical protein
MINLENEIVLHRTAKNVSIQEEYKFIFEPLCLCISGRISERAI